LKPFQRGSAFFGGSGYVAKALFLSKVMVPAASTVFLIKRRRLILFWFMLFGIDTDIKLY
jgi:hypothetical protein